MSGAWLHLLVIVIGLAGGLAVGSGLVAFITVLDIIPRLAQATRSFSKIASYEQAVIVGAVFWTFAHFEHWRFSFWPIGASILGLLQGVFIGMLAAALTEVLNVFPILAKRVRVERYLVWFVLAVVLGKIAGSLFDWLVYQKL